MPNQPRFPTGGNPDSLPREIADQVLAKAIDLQHEWGEIIPTAQLRSTATEIGIDRRYFDIALAEVGAGRKLAAPRQGSVRVLPLLAALAVGAFAGAAWAGGDSAPPPAPAPAAVAAAPAAAPPAASPPAAAPEAPAPAAAPPSGLKWTDPGEIAAAIKGHCQKEWETDFSMRAYCEGQQREALVEIAKMDGRSGGMPAATYAGVRRTCEEEWAPDFTMISYCLDQQADGYAKVAG